MIAITDHAEGAVLPVRVQPGARKNAIVGEYNGALKIAVTAPPEGGRANAAVGKFISERLGVKRSQVAVLSGVVNRNKALLIRGFTREQLAVKLTMLLPPG